MGVKTHPRTLEVQRAQTEISRALLDIGHKYQLTPIELMICLQSEFSAALKYLLRKERHPKNPDQPADLL